MEIQYDFSDNNYVKEDTSKTVKFLINLYDGNPMQYKELAKNTRVEFAQHEKLTCKPINLINFFMNLLWDDLAPNNSQYMKFLTSICYFKNKGITINQENIFKVSTLTSLLFADLYPPASALQEVPPREPEGRTEVRE